jgi:hypothetical protein
VKQKSNLQQSQPPGTNPKNANLCLQLTNELRGGEIAKTLESTIYSAEITGHDSMQPRKSKSIPFATSK